MKKKSKIKKGKLVLLGLAGAALITSLVYDNLKNNHDEIINEDNNNEDNSFEEVIREEE